MCFIVQGSTFQFDKIKNSLWLLSSKQRYCLGHNKWHWHHSDCHISHHPTGVCHSSCTAHHPWQFFLGCEQKSHLLKVMQLVHKPAGCRELLYHLHPRNHHRCSPRLFCKIFQPALRTGSTHSPSLTFIWKTKENFSEHFMERQNQRIYARWFMLLEAVCSGSCLKSIEYLQCFALYKFSSETSEHDIKCNYTNERSLHLPSDPVNEKITPRWSLSHCSNNYIQQGNGALHMVLKILLKQ